MSLQPPSDPRLTIALSEPLSTRELEERLDEALDAVLSSRRTAQPLALGLAPLDREWQDFALHWVSVIARTSSEMAYRSQRLLPMLCAVSISPPLKPDHPRDGHLRPRRPLSRQLELKNLDAFIAASRSRSRAVAFEDARNVLGLFICGLAGRRLKLESGNAAYTDTETIYLPACSTEYASREQNFIVYKAMATHLWAQTRYGTFSIDPAAQLASYPDLRRALAPIITSKPCALTPSSSASCRGSRAKSPRWAPRPAAAKPAGACSIRLPLPPTAPLWSACSMTISRRRA